MKKICFAAALAALAFSACSTSDPDETPPSSSSINSTTPSSSSSPGGCLTKIQGVNNQCVEESEHYNKQLCSTTMSEWVDSCPAGGATCEKEMGGFKGVFHFYLENNPCSSTPSSSSSSIVSTTPSSSSSSIVSTTPSSSSIGSSTTSGACYFEEQNFDWSFCVEDRTESIDQAQCALANAMMGGSYISSFKNSCPPEYKYKCVYDDSYYYVYGKEAEASDCDLFEYEDDEDEDEG